MREESKELRENIILAAGSLCVLFMLALPALTMIMISLLI